MLNHSLPIKLDRSNYILWRTQMENVIFANGFEEYVEGLKVCPLVLPKQTQQENSIKILLTGEDLIE